MSNGNREKLDVLHGFHLFLYQAPLVFQTCLMIREEYYHLPKNNVDCHQSVKMFVCNFKWCLKMISSPYYAVSELQCF